MDTRIQPLPLGPATLDGLSSKLLHELSVDCLGGDGTAMTPAMALALQANFGSVERWRDEFVAMGRALGGGSGWVLLTFQPREGTLVNQWCADHAHDLAGGVPILALDMYEHAYHLDYGANAAAYIDAFMRNIGWSGVQARCQAAVHAATESFGADADAAADAVVLDVRRAGVFEQATTMLPKARWFDPADLAAWSATMPSDRALVVYCIHGHEVSRSTALRLRAAGLNARFLRGGIDAWQSAGRPVVAKPLDGEWK